MMYQLVPVPGAFVYIRSLGVKWCEQVQFQNPGVFLTGVNCSEFSANNEYFSVINLDLWSC